MTNLATEQWDLEEVPYDTNDPAGGWYLHWDKTGEVDEDALYLSRGDVTEARAKLLAAAPKLLAALQVISRTAKIYSLLKQHDPKALEQVCHAIDIGEGRVEPPDRMICNECGFVGDDVQDFLSTPVPGERHCPKCHSADCHVLVAHR